MIEGQVVHHYEFQRISQPGKEGVFIHGRHTTRRNTPSLAHRRFVGTGLLLMEQWPGRWADCRPVALVRLGATGRSVMTPALN